MTALTSGRDTLARTNKIRGVLTKANTKGYAGGIAVLDAGYAKPAVTATSLIAIGRFEHDYDNTGGVDGDVTAMVQAGEYCWSNSTAGDAITQADVGQDCYLVDDQTVAKTSASGTRSRAGVIAGVDTKGVWVNMGLGI